MNARLRRAAKACLLTAALGLAVSESLRADSVRTQGNAFSATPKRTTSKLAGRPTPYPVGGTANPPSLPVAAVRPGQSITGDGGLLPTPVPTPTPGLPNALPPASGLAGSEPRGQRPGPAAHPKTAANQPKTAATRSPGMMPGAGRSQYSQTAGAIAPASRQPSQLQSLPQTKRTVPATSKSRTAVINPETVQSAPASQKVLPVQYAAPGSQAGAVQPAAAPGSLPGAPQGNVAPLPGGQSDDVQRHIQEMYRRDGRTPPDFSVQNAGQNFGPQAQPAVVTPTQSANLAPTANAAAAQPAHKPNFVQRYLPGVSRFLPGGRGKPLPSQQPQGQPTAPPQQVQAQPQPQQLPQPQAQPAAVPPGRYPTGAPITSGGQYGAINKPAGATGPNGSNAQNMVRPAPLQNRPLPLPSGYSPGTANNAAVTGTPNFAPSTPVAGTPEAPFQPTTPLTAPAETQPTAPPQALPVLTAPAATGVGTPGAIESEPASNGPVIRAQPKLPRLDEAPPAAEPAKDAGDDLLLEEPAKEKGRETDSLELTDEPEAAGKPAAADSLLDSEEMQADPADTPKKTSANPFTGRKLETPLENEPLPKAETRVIPLDDEDEDDDDEEMAPIGPDAQEAPKAPEAPKAVGGDDIRTPSDAATTKSLPTLDATTKEEPPLAAPKGEPATINGLPVLNPTPESDETESPKETTKEEPLIDSTELPAPAASETTPATAAPSLPDLRELPNLSEPGEAKKPSTTESEQAPKLPTPPVNEAATPKLPTLDVTAPSVPTTPTEPSLAPAAPGTAPQLPVVTAPKNEREATEMPKLAAKPQLKGFKGFCPVTLRNQRRLIEASKNFSSEFEGKRFEFASLDAKAEFDAAPQKYVPVSNGTDIVFAAAGQNNVEGSLDHAVWYRGRLFLFSSQASRDTFVESPQLFAPKD